MKLITRSLLVLFMLLSSFTLYAQYKAEQVNNVVRVKFTSVAEQQVSATPTNARANQILMTGLNAIDRLNTEYQVREMKRVFPYAGKFEEKHRKYGLHLWYDVSFDRNVSVEIVLNSFKNISEVANCTPVFKYSTGETISAVAPNDPNFEAQWHYDNQGQTGGTVGADMKLLEAWDVQTGDSRVVVSVHDSGIDFNHEDLVGNLWYNEGEIPNNGIDDDNNGYIDDYYGWDFHYDTNDVYDYHSHGTHVSGTVAAESNNGVGVAGVAGGSGFDDGVRIMTMSLNADGSNSIYNPAPSFIYAADMGAVISQNSWGGGSYDQSLVDAINYFLAEAGSEMMNGGIVIMSSGNSDSPSEDYRSQIDGVMMVSATTHNDTKSWYSNYGDWVDISAPGGETANAIEGVLSTTPNNSYSYFQGTSMACPHVSGVAALIVSEYGSPTFSPATLWDMLIDTTDPIDDLNPAYQGQLGSGRLNAARALGEGNSGPEEPAPVARLVVSPEYIYTEVDEGETAEAVFKIINSGEIETDFTLIVPDRNWLSVDEISGTIASGASKNITLTFDADAYSGGYTDGIILQVTSSLVETSYVDVYMQVLGEAIVSVDPLDLGNTFVGYPLEGYLQVSNTGTNYCDITNVISSNTDFVIGETSFEGIKWGQSVYIPVTFTPSAEGSASTTINIEGTVSLSTIVSAEVLVGDPAMASVSPSEISIQTQVNQQGEEEVIITNEGDHDFTYSLVPHYSRGPLATMSSAVSPYTYYPKAKKGENTIFGEAKLQASGYTDEYRWVDNSTGGAVSYDWVDISTTGTKIIDNRDDNAVLVSLSNFVFPFYENEYSRFYVSTNGLLSFGVENTSFSNDRIPNASTPNNFIAPWWDDLVAKSIYLLEKEDHVVIQYGVVHYSNSVYFEIQVILWEDGRIKFQYKGDSNQSDATVGIEGPDGLRGVEVAYGESYAQDGRALLFKPREIFYTLDKTEGVVSAGSSDTFKVLYNTTDYDGNTSYEGLVQINTEDIAQSMFEIPVDLSVGGYAKIKLEEDDLNLGEVFIDTQIDFPVVIINTGTAVLSIEEIASSDITLVGYTYPMSVEVGDTLILDASIIASTEGDFYGSLEISSNDPNYAVIPFEVEADAILIPEYSSTEASSFDWSIDFGRVAKDTLTFSNEVVGSSLEYSVSLHFSEEEEEVIELSAYSDLSVNVYTENNTLESTRSQSLEALSIVLSQETEGKKVGISDSDLNNYSILIEDGDAQGIEWIYLNDISESSLSEIDLYIVDDEIINLQTSELEILKDWIAQGGSLILLADDYDSSWNVNFLLEGSGLIYYTYSDYYDEYIYDFASHPITNQLVELHAQGAGAYYEVEGDAEQIVFTQNGNAFAAVSIYEDGRIVGIGNENFSDYDLTIADNRLFANQAIAWALKGNGHWLKVSPISGEVEGGQSQDLVLSYNAQNLVSDTTYTATLAIETNEPNTEAIEYAISLEVQAAPLVKTSTNEIYMSAYTMLSYDGSFTLKNNGSGTATLNAIELPSEDVSLIDMQMPIVIGVNEELEVFFDFTPSEAGLIEDSFILTFDEPQEDLEIAFNAVIQDAALLELPAEDMELAIAVGGSTDTTFTLMNNGNVDLHYTMNLVEGSSFNEIEAAVTSMQNRWDSLTGQSIQLKGVDGSLLTVQAEDQSPITIQSSGFAGFNIAIISTRLYDETPVETFDVVDSLLASEKYASVTTIDASLFMPSWTELLSYDGIILARGDYNFIEAYYLESVLRSYLEGKGSLVQLYPDVADTQIDLGDARLMSGLFSNSGEEVSMVIEDENHAIFSEIDALGLDVNSYVSKSVTTYNDPEILATWETGEPLVLTAKVNGVQRTDLNYALYSTETDLNGYSKGSQGASLLANALEWTILQNIGTEVEWLDADKYAGTIASGASEQLTLTIDASELNEGYYMAYAKIRSNNIYPESYYAIAVDVYGEPAIEARNPHFGEHLIGSEYVQSINVVNVGDGSLDVEQMIVTGEFELVSDYEFTIPYNDSTEIALRYLPESEGEVTGELIMISTEGEEYRVGISAEGVLPGRININPQSLEYALEYNSSGTETLTLSNTGEGELKFQFNNFYPEELKHEGSQNNTNYIEFAKEPQKGELDNRVGHPVINGYGYGDGGYFFMDSREEYEVAPVYNWVDISENDAATSLVLTDDDAKEVQLPFEVNLFGYRFTKVYVSSNGYLSFNPEGANLPVNQQIPDTRTPNAVIAPLWKDLNPAAGEGVVHYLINEEEGTLSVQYTNVQTFSGDAVYTFQVKLTRGGNMLFQYEQVEELHSENLTIGAENYDGTEGIQVAFNTDYLEEGLAVAIYPPAEYIVPNITKGSIAVGESMDIEVTVNTLNLLGGSYIGEILISSLDPRQPQSIVPVYIDVTGEPMIRVSQDTIVYQDSVLANDAEYEYLEIYNDGTDTLHISEVVSTSENFNLILEDSAIAPREMSYAFVSFMPTEAISYEGTLSIISNADTVIDIQTYGDGKMPNVILAASPSEIFDSLGVDTQATHTVTLSNDGTDSLFFEIDYMGTREYQEVNIPAAIAPSNKGNDVSEIGRNTRSNTVFVESIPTIDIELPSNMVLSTTYISSMNWSPFRTVFDMNNPYQMGVVKELEDLEFYAGGIILEGNQTYLELGSEGTLYEYDMVTDNLIDSWYLGSEAWTSITLDPTTDQLYLSTVDALYLLDKTNAGYQANFIGSYTQSNVMISIAVIGNGEMYAYDLGNDYLYEVDKETADTNPVGYIGFDASYGQNMAWDPNSGILWMAAHNGDRGTSELRMVDIYSGNTALVSDLGGNYGAVQVSWLAFTNQESFVSTDIREGVIAPGESLDVAVTLDATDLLNGIYGSGLSIASNDPVNPVYFLPIEMTVGGNEPLIVLEDYELDFGNPFIFETSEVSFTLKNEGSEVLLIDTIFTSSEVFTIEGYPMEVPIDGEIEVIVNLNPAEVGVLNETLTIQSNAPETLVSLVGTVRIPEVYAEVMPYDLVSEQPTNELKTKVLIIRNLGESVALDWDIEIADDSWLSMESTSGSVAPLGEERVSLEFNSEELPRGFYDTALLLTTNDPNMPSMIIPVTLDVINSMPVVANPLDTVVIDLDSGMQFVDMSEVFVDADSERVNIIYAEIENEWAADVMGTRTGFYVEPYAVDTTFVRVIAEDPRGALVETNVDLVIEYNGENQVPTYVGNVTDVTLEYQGNPFVSTAIINMFEDADNDDLYFEVESSDEAIAKADIVAGLLVVEPEALGSAEILLKASDPFGGIAEVMFTTTVEFTGENAIPTVAMPMEDMEIDLYQGSYTLDIRDVFHDADYDRLMITPTVLDELVASVRMSGHELTISPEKVGQTTVQLTAADGKGGEVTEEFTLDVFYSGMNNLPVVMNYPEDQSISLQGGDYLLPIYDVFYDDDGDVLILDLELSDESKIEAEFDFGNGYIAVSPLMGGSTTLTLMANDSKSEEWVSVSFEVEVIDGENSVPSVTQLELQDIVPNEVATIDLSTIFTDADGDALTYHAESSSELVRATIANGILSLNATEATDAEVTVSANDGKSSDVSMTFGVHANTLPVLLSELPNIEVMETPSIYTLDASMYFEDADGDELVYTAQTEVGNVGLAFSDNLLFITIDDKVSGSVNVTAEDGRGGVVETSFEITLITSADDALVNSVLEQNAPNPFNTTTTIKYSISEKSDVSLRLYTSDGRFVKEVVSDVLTPGDYQVELSKEELQTGLYFYILTVGDQQHAKRMIVE